MAETTAAKKVTLVSCDERTFVVEKALATQCVTIKNMLEDIGESDEPIALPEVKGKSLELVLDFCRYHQTHPSTAQDKAKFPDSLDPWDKEFCGALDTTSLLELILAANYLETHELLDATCKTIANMIKGKTPEEIRKHFGVQATV